MEENTLLFDKAIQKIEFIFRYAGFNIQSGEQKASAHAKSRIIYMINFMWLNTDFAGAIYWFIDGVKSGKDFLELTYLAPCISLSTFGNIKGLFVILNEKHVHKLIMHLRRLEIEEKERKQSLEKDEIIEQETKFLNLVLKTFKILYGMVIVMFTSSPFVIIAVKYYQTNEVELILPFLILYPFDPYQIKVWPFVYLHQFWSECVVSMYICAADFFFFTCCTYIRIQFRLLRHDLENIIPKEGNSNKKFIEDEEFKNNFKDLVKRHQNLIELSNILEIIYSKSTLLNFICSSLIICLAGFNVTMVNDVAIVMTFLTFLSMSLVQVFFLCFFADLLTGSSTEISDGIYNSQWFMAESKIVKQLLLVQTRSMDPCKLTASGFADVNLNCFMRVLSTAWSYFALLQTMYSN